MEAERLAPRKYATTRLHPVGHGSAPARAPRRDARAARPVGSDRCCRVAPGARMAARRSVSACAVCDRLRRPAGRRSAAFVQHAQAGRLGSLRDRHALGAQFHGLEPPGAAYRSRRPLRLQRADEPDVLPPADAIVVALATFNAINWAAGVGDLARLGPAQRGTRSRLPVVAVPYPNIALADVPPFRRSVTKLETLGVRCCSIRTHTRFRRRTFAQPAATCSLGRRYARSLPSSLLSLTLDAPAKCQQRSSSSAAAASAPR